ncbi:hypothetical protein ACTA71_002502 [Dictyostelium dimigraforme]
MSDMADNEIELDKIIHEVVIGIKKYGKYKKGVDGIDHLKNRIDRAKQILRSYKLDLRELPKIEIVKYDSKVKNYEEQIKKLENDLNWVENIGNDGGVIVKNKNNDEMLKNQDQEYQNIMKRAKDTQQQDNKITKGILETVIETNNIGTSTLEEMKRQEDQIISIQKDMEEIDGNLKLATRQMRSFARKMATDKIIMGFILLIIVGIIAIIVYKSIKK